MERQWLCLYLPNFACQRVLREKPSLRRKAFAVTEQVGQTVKVVDCSPTAQRQGIEQGMTLSAARALVPELPAVQADEEKDHQALMAIGSWARCFGPSVYHYDAQSLVIDVSGSLHLFGNELRLIRKALKGLGKLSYVGQAGVAESARKAHVLAWSRQKDVSQAPVHCFTLSEQTLDSLYSLGITHIEHLLALPRREMAARFDEELSSRIAELLGEAPEDLRAIEQVSTISERVEFDPPIENGSSLTFIAKRLVDRIAERLKGMGLGAKHLVLSLHDELRHIEQVHIHAAQALDDGRALMLLVSTQLEKLQECERIVEADLSIKEHAPTQNRHYSLFEPKPKNNIESFTGLIDRLSARLGANNVARIELIENYRPEKAWRALPCLEGGSNQSQSTKLPLRPTLLFDDPYPLSIQLHKGRIKRIDGQRVVSSQGPERIVSAWWDGSGVHRDYWRVMLEDGRWLWVYRDARTGSFYEHGVFA